MSYRPTYSWFFWKPPIFLLSLILTVSFSLIMVTHTHTKVQIYSKYSLLSLFLLFVCICFQRDCFILDNQLESGKPWERLVHPFSAVVHYLWFFVQVLSEVFFSSSASIDSVIIHVLLMQSFLGDTNSHSSQSSASQTLAIPFSKMPP